MVNVIDHAVEAGHIAEGADVFTQGDSRAVWFDKYFLHSAELVGDEYIYQTAPLVNDWQFEDWQDVT